VEKGFGRNCDTADLTVKRELRTRVLSLNSGDSVESFAPFPSFSLKVCFVLVQKLFMTPHAPSVRSKSLLPGLSSFEFLVVRFST